MLKNEVAETIVKPNYIKTNNKQFWDYYTAIDKEKDLVFNMEIHNIQFYDYIFNANKDKVPKKTQLQKGKN